MKRILMVNIFLMTLMMVGMLTVPAMAVPISGLGAPSSDPALTGGTVIDFEDQALGTYAFITIGGVTFTANDNHLQIDNTYQQYNQQGIYLDNGTYLDNGFGSLTVSFAGTTDAFAFNWGMAEPFATWTLTAYDSLSNVLDTYNLPSTSNSSAGEYYGIAASGISYANLSWTGTYDWVAIDNFTYTAAVPEPGTILLLGSGLAGLGLWGRKRFKANS